MLSTPMWPNGLEMMEGEQKEWLTKPSDVASVHDEVWLIDWLIDVLGGGRGLHRKITVSSSVYSECIWETRMGWDWQDQILSYEHTHTHLGNCCMHSDIQQALGWLGNAHSGTLEHMKINTSEKKQKATKNAREIVCFHLWDK